MAYSDVRRNDSKGSLRLSVHLYSCRFLIGCRKSRHCSMAPFFLLRVLKLDRVRAVSDSKCCDDVSTRLEVLRGASTVTVALQRSSSIISYSECAQRLGHHSRTTRYSRTTHDCNTIPQPQTVGVASWTGTVQVLLSAGVFFCVWCPALPIRRLMAAYSDVLMAYSGSGCAQRNQQFRKQNNT